MLDDLERRRSVDRCGHGGGGSLGFRWHWRGDKFLRLDGSELAFKVETEDSSARKAKWCEWNRRLIEKTETCGLTLVTPRRKLGRRMTVAVLAGDYRQTDAGGRLDLERTVGMLRKAEALMDTALETS